MTVPNTSYCMLKPGIKIITMCVLCESAGIPLSLQNFNEPISTHWGIYVHCWVDVYYLIGKLSMDILICACHTLVFLSSLFQISFCSGWLLFLYFVLLCCCFCFVVLQKVWCHFFGGFWPIPINSALLFQYELHNIYVVLIIYIYIYNVIIHH